jgi:hypothetical protein
LDHAVVAISEAWGLYPLRIHRPAPQAFGKAWPSRLDVTDGKDCATGSARLAGKIRALNLALEQGGSDSCEFLDHNFVIGGIAAANSARTI